MPVDGQLAVRAPDVNISGAGSSHLPTGRDSFGSVFSEENYEGTVRRDWMLTMHMWLLGRGAKPLREVDSESL